MADLRPVKAYLRLKGLNQLLKGNMWSAIPVALLCMLVIVGVVSRTAAPKETMFCKTQEDFCPIEGGREIKKGEMEKWKIALCGATD